MILAFENVECVAEGTLRIARGIVPNKKYTIWSFEPGIN